MRTNFEKCYTIVRVYEGGNVNNKKDPGGRTSRGVTQATYNAYRRHKGQPTKDVYAATDVEVKDIYKTQYWLTSGADSAPVGVDLVLFDAAINSGSNRAIRLLQASLNAVDKIQPPLAVDGNMGAHTIDAMTVNKDNDKLIGEYGQATAGLLSGPLDMEHIRQRLDRAEQELREDRASVGGWQHRAKAQNRIYTTGRADVATHGQRQG
jgi:lysozyme family protein